MIPYWKDNCPICEEPCIKACRCPLNDRKCENGHWWRRIENDDIAILEHGHGEPIRVIRNKNC